MKGLSCNGKQIRKQAMQASILWRADNFVKINDAFIPALGSPVFGS